MSRLICLVFWAATVAASLVASTSEAQFFSYNRSQYIIRPQREYVASPQFYGSNGVQYQSYRPNFNQDGRYRNGRYYVQPQQTYSYYASPYNGQSYSPSYVYPNGQPTYGSTSFYQSQPGTVYGNFNGTGYYSSPQQATNANRGAIIGGAINGNQGAQVGAAIGAAIRP